MLFTDKPNRFRCTPATVSSRFRQRSGSNRNDHKIMLKQTHLSYPPIFSISAASKKSFCYAYLYEYVNSITKIIYPEIKY